MYKIKRIGIISAGAMMAGVSFFIGIVSAIIICLFGVGANTIMPGYTGYIGMGIGGVLLGVAIATILEMIVGFFIGAISALFYNIVAKIFGGIAVELENDLSMQKPIEEHFY